MPRSCFACSRARTRSPPTPPPRRRTPTQAEIQAAKTIQRVFRGGATRSALRSGQMRRTVTKQRTASLAALASLPANVKRTVVRKAQILRVPGTFNKKQAPKRQLSPGMQQWLRLAHTNAFSFPSTANYNAYINRLGNLTWGGIGTSTSRRANLIKAILARYELLQPHWFNGIPGASVTSPRVKAWRGRLETNFKRKYVPRRQNRLSSRELYSFLLTAPRQYLVRAARTAPTYA